MSNVLDTVFVDYEGPAVPASWLNAVGSATNGSKTPTSIVATAGQTIFTVPASALGHVYINGVFQIPNSSYTRTDATTITFSEGLPVNARMVVL